MPVATLPPTFNDETYARMMTEPQRKAEMTGVLELKTGELLAGYLEPGGAEFGVPVVRVRVPENSAAGVEGFIRLYPWSEIRSITPTDSVTVFELAADICGPAIPVTAGIIVGEWDSEGLRSAEGEPTPEELEALEDEDESADDFDPAAR